MLFQLYELRILLDIIGYFLLISGYLFIVISGAFNLRREEKYNGAIFFVIIGAVELIYKVVSGRVYNYIYMVMGYSPLSMMIVHAILRVIPSIISIITFGVLFLLLWKKNYENHGKKLLLSGIFWIVYSVVLLINSILTWDFFPLSPNIYIILQEIVLGVSVLMIVSRIFFLVYAIKINERFLLISSIFLLSASIVLINFYVLEFMYFIGLI